MNLNLFTDFCKQKFHLLEMAVFCPETRRKPEIPLWQLFLLMVMGLALRKRSFHQIDLWARTAGAKRVLGSHRGMVASDATLWRVLPQMAVDRLRELVQQTFVRWKNLEGFRFTLPSGRQVRLGIVDGSQFGKFLASCLQIKTDFGDYFLDLELSAGRGHELATTERLIERATSRHGKGFLDLLLGDGLYLTANMFTLCRRLGTHLLVKTSEETLNIVKDARALFSAPAMRDRVEIHRGEDKKRGVRFTVQAAKGFRHEGYEGTLKVAWVVEELLKPTKGRRKPEPFWVVTTDERLSTLDLRELAHERWSVENRGFKMLNEQMNSKHVWTRGTQSQKTFEVLMLLMFLAFALIKTYESSLSEEALWSTFHIRSVTMDFLVTVLLSSLESAESPLVPVSS